MTLGVLDRLGTLVVRRWLPLAVNFVPAKHVFKSVRDTRGHLRNPRLLAICGRGFTVLFSLAGVFTYANFYLAHQDGKRGRNCMKSHETTEEVSAHGGEKACGKALLAPKGSGSEEKWIGEAETGCEKTCKTLEQEENHKKQPTRSWARTHMGNLRQYASSVNSPWFYLLGWAVTAGVIGTLQFTNYPATAMTFYRTLGQTQIY